ncbi:glycine betaine ABC transporter substrate-binding protein OsmF [Segnochrobactrum spirostomi]|uniref:ABC transporter substrate-binding protein n=1 Tax=Segnochrobactrum spirostomi TaxID=2608987 RepID=A0A6A7Y625_9HYPH|nr:ABC transporter substrate-binding protein [Segnochrobactrum spirostomi]MQT13541.1 ABC transporter substrate-binding protein [Segnochrobactrum spirostomi]
MLKRLAVLATAALVLAAAPLARPALAAGPVVVGSKIDTEGALLGNIIAIALENAGIPVERKIQLGPTKIVRTALISGEIGIYPEYTGNAGFFFNIDSDPAWKNAASAYAKAKQLDAEKNNLVWLKPAPANNTWAIAIRKDVAEANKLATLDDFGKWVSSGGKVKLAGSAEFVESAAALPAFEKAYDFKLSPDQLLVLSGGDTAATIKAAAEQTSGVNAAMAYGTDGALAALGLVVLTDTKGVQAVYEPAPVVRADVLKEYPKIETVLDPIFASLSLETLQSLNAKIAVDGEDPKTVATDYLKSKGFLK